MNNLITAIIAAIIGAIQVTLLILYLFGMYSLVFDDHRYTTKDLLVGAVVFPYAIYIGGKEAYKIMTMSSENRDGVERCLNKAEYSGAPRKLRVKICDCMGENLPSPNVETLMDKCVNSRIE